MGSRALKRREARQSWAPIVGERQQFRGRDAHLSNRGTVDAQAANDAQCAELASVLASYVGGATVFGGDVNRHESCAPAGWWTLTDAAASQAPGIQHVYGNERLASPTGTVVPAVHTDHDFLRADARRTPAPR